MQESVFLERYLSRLNPQQRAAATAADGHILLLATPGSGKTTVLVTRLGYLIGCRGVDPGSILALTYTRAATRDMQERYIRYFGAAPGLQIRTINGISQEIILAASRQRGQEPFRLLANEGEQMLLIRAVYQTIHEGQFPEDATLRDIRTAITYIKNRMLTEEEIAAYKCGVDGLLEIFAAYQKRLRESRRMDYDDQMVYARRILLTHPDILAQYQNRFRYVCVDEAQDTSKIQHEIIKLLAAGHGNLFMVGDEDQSIYGFRAAYPEAMLRFTEDYPDAKVLLLEENYRSTPEIVLLANRFLASEPRRYQKTIRPTRPSGVPVQFVSCGGREGQIEHLLRVAADCTAETAILCRNNESLLPLIDRFEQAGIPYQCRNFEDSFFSHRVTNDVRDIIRFAYDPADADAFLRIYYKFDLAIPKTAALAAVRTGGPLPRALLGVRELRASMRPQIVAWMECLQRMKTANAETAVGVLWEELGYGRYVKKKGLDTGKLFLLSQLARGVPSPARLLEKLDALQRTVAEHTNDRGSSVILSTVHSAKGLEFERVYLLDVLDGILPQKTKAELATEEDQTLYAEERRLFYVAATRAKDELYLFRCGEPASFITESSRLLHPPGRQTAKSESGTLVTEQNRDQLQCGMTIHHSAFGSGKVEALDRDFITIRFDAHGTKRFLLRYCIAGQHLRF